jgi:hypothetical protein
MTFRPYDRDVSETVEPQLAASVVRLLSGTELASAVGTTFELITVDEQGWPHVALLSAGEILATGPSSLRLALWASSGTTANLTWAGRALLTFVHDHAYYRVRMTVAQIEAPETGSRPLAAFLATVVEVQVDEVPYATVTGGITFELADAAGTVKRWSDTLEALRDA